MQYTFKSLRLKCKRSGKRCNGEECLFFLPKNKKALENQGFRIKKHRNHDTLSYHNYDAHLELVTGDSP